MWRQYYDFEYDGLSAFLFPSIGLVFMIISYSIVKDVNKGTKYEGTFTPMYAWELLFSFHFGLYWVLEVWVMIILEIKVSLEIVSIGLQKAKLKILKASDLKVLPLKMKNLNTLLRR